MSEDVKKIILVVDDEPLNLMIAQKMLSTNYKVAPAKSGAAALQYLEKNMPNLILMDINMPEMNGFETMEAIRAKEGCGDIPVIFLTADCDDETREKCMSYGAVGFIGKPFVPNVLLGEIAGALEV